MYPSFTGNARRPRQVNLSGRQNPNPFASKSGSAPGTSNAVVNAQQNRLARQQDRVRAQAASSLQRVWRGYSTRQRIRAQERVQWDAEQEVHSGTNAADSLYKQLIRMLHFFDPRDERDCGRLQLLSARIQAALRQHQISLASSPWPNALLRLQNLCLCGLERGTRSVQSLFVELLGLLVQAIPNLTAQNSPHYYETLSGLHNLSSLPLDIVLAPLRHLDQTTVIAYQSLALHLLTLPDLQARLGGQEGLSALAAPINAKLLTAAVASFLRSESTEDGEASRRRLKLRRQGEQDGIWLLGHLVYINRHVFNFNLPAEHAAGEDFTYVAATLLSSVSDEIVIEPPIEGQMLSRGDILEQKILDPFLAEQISALVNQDSIGGLVSSMNISASATSSRSLQLTSHSRVLAGFILTLLRLFPRRSDDIRMWLYLGPSTSRERGHGSDTVINFFWQSVRSTGIFAEITADPRAVTNLLKAQQLAAPAINPAFVSRSSNASRPVDLVQDEWRVVLLFVELYSFVLKVMDDEEFFTQPGDELAALSKKSLRINSLSLEDIKALSTFLKHLGFTMYYYAADIIGSREEESAKDISSLFKPQQMPEQAHSDPREKYSRTTSIHGISLDHMKGSVTGLVRAIYERDSRRPFLPKDHWLMTSRFDMANFIDSVVEEEERRHRVQEAEDDDDDDEDPEPQSYARSTGLVGTSHAQRLAKIEQMRREQRKASRRRYLQAVAPRLEILQNMPFLIPFTTRVQIFRRFVHMDQLKRRDGTVDPELWRLSHHHGMDPLRGMTLERHQAKVRRGHEFEDAYEQFYDLGSGLKEPINITFVDQFDQPEAGIDGGGVTKEFLTSVTSEAFKATNGIRLFAETDKHLMFPNPSAIEEQKELLLEQGVPATSPKFRSTVTELLQRYEFLGRIIGKCLYEGILVDIGFAGFFLLKWALTGGTGSAPRESGYRANLNDLRDYDEALYQGLVSLLLFAGP